MAKFSYTYHPYNGAILAGDKTEIDAKHINHNSNVIASITRDKSQMTKDVMVAKDQNITQLFTATESKTSIHAPELIATVNALKQMQGQNRFTASFNNALVADANRDNIKHMQMIKLITRMLGFPEMYFHLHNLFTENDVPQLEARQPLQDVFEQQGPIGRYARTPDSDLQFAEIKYDLKKYPIRIPTPIEDIFRTLLNPHEAKINQITWARGKRHNQEALTQLLKIETTKAMSKIDKLDAGDFHSENSTVGELNDIISEHLTTHHSMLTHVGMGPKMFRKLVENTWTYNVAGPRPNRVIQGVYEFPGIDGTTVVVDPMLDANVNTKNAMFVIDKQNGAQYGQGPVLSKVYEDNERDAHVTKNIEFFQYLVVDGSNVIVNNDVSFDRKFALKINVAQ